MNQLYQYYHQTGMIIIFETVLLMCVPVLRSMCQKVLADDSSHNQQGILFVQELGITA